MNDLLTLHPVLATTELERVDLPIMGAKSISLLGFVTVNHQFILPDEAGVGGQTSRAFTARVFTMLDFYRGEQPLSACGRQVS